MARLYGQAAAPVLVTTGNAQSVLASGSISGSAVSSGYKTLIGLFYSNASAATGAASGLVITQSANNGATWDYTSASYAVTASAASGFSVPVYGNAVKVQYWNGVTSSASLVRAAFYLVPV